MLGLSEVLFGALAAVVVIGPKGLPRAANSAGYFLGSTMRFLRDSRKTLEEFSKEQQLQDLHTQVQVGMVDLRNIRGEWDHLTQSSSWKAAILRPTTKAPFPNEGEDKDEAASNTSHLPQQQHNVTDSTMGTAARPPRTSDSSANMSHDVAQQQQTGVDFALRSFKVQAVLKAHHGK